MEKRAIIELLKKPEYLKLYTIDELKNLSAQYPYFKQLKVLLLKKTQMVEPEEAKQILHKIATDTPNRSVLYNLLQQPIDNLPVQLEAKKKVVDVPLEVIRQVKAKRRPKKKNQQPIVEGKPVEEVERELQRLRLLANAKNKQKTKRKTLHGLNTSAVEKEVIQDLQKLRMNQATNQNDGDSNEVLLDSIRKKIERFSQNRNIKQSKPEDYSEEDIKKMLRNDKENLSEIYQFIEEDKDERLKKMPKMTAEEAAKNSSTKDLENPTETLALLYTKQGSKSEALRVYEKLRLKYPEKSVYFAEKIENLRNS